MKLSYSIPGKIWWITNFLNYHMYKNIHDAIIKERTDINLHTAKGVWNEDLINNIEPPMTVGIKNYKPFEQLKTLVRHNAYFQLNDSKEMSPTIHYMKKGSGINQHNDYKWKYGATYYINRRWHPQWGGEFMFTDGAGHGWIPVTGNSLVIIKSPIQHKVNPVLTNIMPRISIQMFMK